jgi:hypothetical protein
MQWEGKIFPFGLRSAPKIFTALSEALEWILAQQGMTSCLHYLIGGSWVVRMQGELAAVTEAV